MDVRTVILTLAISSFVFGFLLIIFQHQKENLDSQVIRYWIIAKFLQGAGSLLLYLNLPAEVLFLIAETLIIIGCAYESWAIFYITDKSVNQQTQWLVSLVIVVICLSTLNLNLTHQASILFLIHTTFYALPGWALLRNSARSLLQSVLGFSYWILALLFGGRGICLAFMPDHSYVVWQQVCEYGLPLAVFCIVLMSGFSMLLLANEKSYRELHAMQNTLKKSEEELKKANKQLAALSNTDGLTGIANRRYFDERFALEYKRLSRQHAELSLVLLDIDYFKNFNDHYGHLAGDACLMRVANTITICLNRPSDLAARYGGEEFACVLPETDRIGAMNLAEKIRIAIEQLGIEHSGSSIAQWVTVSVGVATIRCDGHDHAPRELLAQADRALYAAKMAGRNRVVIDSVE
ncbi:sensor domain-containing diguanylate cyclase [Thiospirillum jenense]|uniref:diguanylate cyclase n=1 Tax=Thiospirillum jenense TaxID=1653858 RepID=A0A839HGM9_9GAMM|nr:diguanylate cyclase [Thiospirillum jenense]MBB1126227.1 GGDEF domain-containing protein [Thiospirillum jenense]